MDRSIDRLPTLAALGSVPSLACALSRHIHMETVIALVRNGACTLKDVVGDRPHWLMHPLYGRVTHIESVIAPTQLAAVLYNLGAALPHLTSAVAGWFAAAQLSETHWVEAIALASAEGESPTACQAASAALASSFASARQKNRVMVAKIFIGLCFLMLFLLTLHRPYPALLNWSLLFLEISIAYLLTVMAAGVNNGRRRAADLRRLAEALEAGPIPTAPSALPLLLGPATGESLPPAPWNATDQPASDPFGVNATSAHVKAVAKLEAKCEAKLRSAGTRAEVAADLRAQSTSTLYQTALDAVLTALNGLAFSGYAMFPLTYFVQEERLAQLVPGWPGHDTAQFWGNLLGDAAWTVEPALAMIVPLMIEKAVASQANEGSKKRA